MKCTVKLHSALQLPGRNYSLKEDLQHKVTLLLVEDIGKNRITDGLYFTKDEKDHKFYFYTVLILFKYETAIEGKNSCS